MQGVVIRGGETPDQFGPVLGGLSPQALPTTDWDDRIDAGAGADEIVGLGGDDRLSGGADADLIDGGDGDDLLLGDEAGPERPGDGADSILAGRGDDTAQGSGGNDTIFGEAGADSLDGGSGADALLGGEGADSLAGQDGADLLLGGGGDDSIAGGLGDDRIDAGIGADSILGGGGDDAVLGGAGADSLAGEAGRDSLAGGAEADWIDGGAGADALLGEAGADTLSGGDGDDLALGGADADSLAGGAGDDSLDGGAGADSLLGGAGDDWLAGGAGGDRLAGGAGADRFLFRDGEAAAGTISVIADWGAGDTILLAGGSAFFWFVTRIAHVALDGDGRTDDVIIALSDGRFIHAHGAAAWIAEGGSGAETLPGNDAVLLRLDAAPDFAATAPEMPAPPTPRLFRDDSPGAGDAFGTGNALANFIPGGAAAEALRGWEGADTLLGQDGADTLNGGTGDDSLDGGAGFDLVSFAGAAGGVVVDLAAGRARGQGTDALAGFEGAIGTGFADVLTGDAAANLLQAGTGGADTITGGAGFDTAGFTDAETALDLDLATGRDAGSGSLLFGIEAVIGTRLDDRIRGDAGANWLGGGAGHDMVGGGGGADTVSGGAGDDSLDGGAGFDLVSFAGAPGGVVVDLAVGRASGEGDDLLAGFEGVIGSAFADRLVGDAGANLLQGGAGGADTLIGGAGFDTASFAGATQGVRLDLGAGTERRSGSVIEGIEAVTGSRFADRLRGDGGANWLGGQDGDDSLHGGAGDDTLHGGAGDDSLAGGSGRDIASFATASAAVQASLRSGLATGDGQDALDGFEGLIGSAFADTLEGGAADDRLRGGAGADRFDIAPGGGRDSILDFTPGEDRLRLAGFGIADVAGLQDHLTEVEGGTLVTLGVRETVLILGLTPEMLGAAEFLFA